jgi:hypothetical protein
MNPSDEQGGLLLLERCGVHQKVRAAFCIWAKDAEFQFGRVKLIVCPV